KPGIGDFHDLFLVGKSPIQVRTRRSCPTCITWLPSSGSARRENMVAADVGVLTSPKPTGSLACVPGGHRARSPVDLAPDPPGRCPRVGLPCQSHDPTFGSPRLRPSSSSRRRCAPGACRVRRLALAAVVLGVVALTVPLVLNSSAAA